MWWRRDASRRSAAEGTRRRGAPVALGGEGGVGEHRCECGVLVGGLIWAEEDYRGGSAASFELVGARVGGGAVPVGIERVGGVVELRGTEAKLLVWSARAEEPQRGGPTAASSSPAFGGRRRWCSWVWGWGIGKQTKGMVCGAICSAQARARTRVGALRRARHGGVAVAAARRFWARRGGVARGGGSSARQQAGEEERRDAWGPARRKKAAGKPLHGAGVGTVGGRRREQSRGWRWKKRAILKFPKIPGTIM